MEILFNLDAILFELIKGSGFVFLTVLGILKILAKETAWAGDDKIISMFIGIITRNTAPNKKS